MSHKIHFLVIEDNPVVITMLQGFLEKIKSHAKHYDYELEFTCVRNIWDAFAAVIETPEKYSAFFVDEKVDVGNSLTEFKSFLTDGKVLQQLKIFFKNTKYETVHDEENAELKNLKELFANNNVDNLRKHLAQNSAFNKGSFFISVLLHFLLIQKPPIPVPFIGSISETHHNLKLNGFYRDNNVPHLIGEGSTKHTKMRDLISIGQLFGDDTDKIMLPFKPANSKSSSTSSIITTLQTLTLSVPLEPTPSLPLIETAKPPNPQPPPSKKNDDEWNYRFG